MFWNSFNEDLLPYLVSAHLASVKDSTSEVGPPQSKTDVNNWQRNMKLNHSGFIHKLFNLWDIRDRKACGKINTECDMQFLILCLNHQGPKVKNTKFLTIQRGLLPQRFKHCISISESLPQQVSFLKQWNSQHASSWSAWTCDTGCVQFHLLV